MGTDCDKVLKLKINGVCVGRGGFFFFWGGGGGVASAAVHITIPREQQGAYYR